MIARPCAPFTNHPHSRLLSTLTRKWTALTSIRLSLRALCIKSLYCDARAHTQTAHAHTAIPPAYQCDAPVLNFGSAVWCQHLSAFKDQWKKREKKNFSLMNKSMRSVRPVSLICWQSLDASHTLQIILPDHCRLHSDPSTPFSASNWSKVSCAISIFPTLSLWKGEGQYKYDIIVVSDLVQCTSRSSSVGPLASG